MVLAVGEEFIPSKGMDGQRLIDKEDVEDDDEESVEMRTRRVWKMRKMRMEKVWRMRVRKLQGKRMSRESMR